MQYGPSSIRPKLIMPIHASLVSMDLVWKTYLDYNQDIYLLRKNNLEQILNH